MKRRIGLTWMLVVLGLALALPATTAAAGGFRVKEVEHGLYHSPACPWVKLWVAVTKGAGDRPGDRYTIDGKIMAIWDGDGPGSNHVLHMFTHVEGTIPQDDTAWQGSTHKYGFRSRDYQGNPYASCDYVHRVFLKVKIWDGMTLLKTISVRSYDGI